ncbi:unnamed protein product [Lampetra planeri]
MPLSSGGERQSCNACLAGVLSAIVALLTELQLEKPPGDIGWTEVEALQALPTTLDDDALAAFDAIPPEDRGTLPKALAEMGAIFDPPSKVRHKVAARWWGEADTPLAFRSALMSLATAAYPKMDHEGLDSMVLERMLSLAQELNVNLPATEEDDLSSLRVAWCLQAHFNLKRRASVAACAGPSELAGAPEGSEPSEACASLGGIGWRKDEAGRQGG